MVVFRWEFYINKTRRNLLWTPMTKNIAIKRFVANEMKDNEEEETIQSGISLKIFSRSVRRTAIHFLFGYRCSSSSSSFYRLYIKMKKKHVDRMWCVQVNFLTRVVVSYCTCLTHTSRQSTPFCFSLVLSIPLHSSSFCFFSIDVCMCVCVCMHVCMYDKQYSHAFSPSDQLQ